MLWVGFVRCIDNALSYASGCAVVFATKAKTLAEY